MSTTALEEKTQSLLRSITWRGMWRVVVPFTTVDMHPAGTFDSLGKRNAKQEKEM